MPFCVNCGKELDSGAKFCPECGAAVSNASNHTHRTQIYDGEIHKCPNCGEVLKSFSANCPACGYELRGTKNTGSVRELQLKLEELYAKRPQRKVHTIFTQALSGGQISNTDEKIV